MGMRKSNIANDYSEILVMSYILKSRHYVLNYKTLLFFFDLELNSKISIIKP